MINLLSDFLLLFYFILGCYIALMGHLHNTIGLGFARGVFSLEYWLRDCDCRTLQLAKYPPQKLYNAAFSNNKMVAWKPYLHFISTYSIVSAPHWLQAPQPLKNVQFSLRWRMLAGSWLQNSRNSFISCCRLQWTHRVTSLLQFVGCQGLRLY